MSSVIHPSFQKECSVKTLPDSPESASVSVFKTQSDGTFLVGFAFAEELVARFFPRSGELQFLQCDLEGAMAVTGGLASTLSGETTFSVLQRGSLPSWLLRLVGANPFSQSGSQLVKNILSGSGGFGFQLRHSVLMLSKDEIELRHGLMPGALLDIEWVGDYLFGLEASAIWREHYLKPEKRETLRSDLEGNLKIARSDDGIIWLLSESGRMLRMQQTDIKAKPTPLKIPGPTLWSYASNSLDTWTYLVCGEGNSLVRVRKNSVTGEEEQQNFPPFESKITALCAVEIEKDPHLLIALQGQSQGLATLVKIPLVRPEDPEFMQELPSIERVGEVEGLQFLGHLGVVKNQDRHEVWAAEGFLGWGQHLSRGPLILKLFDF